MNRLLISFSLVGLLASPLAAQDFTELWLLGEENGNQSEFSQEGGLNEAPGSPEALDDDFYFAGTYADPIGMVVVDEAFVHYDRALTPGDPFNRIHFNLDAVGADSGTQLRFSMQLCCLGAANEGESVHDLAVRFNGNEILSKQGIAADELVQETVAAGDVEAREGANVIEIERTDGSASAWVQFDFLLLEAGAVDGDGDGLPDTFEELYAFLDPQAAGDAALDKDEDGLSNLEEFVAGSDPGMADTDGDTLSDGDEVRIHRTDAARADTDLDGIGDAAEVREYETDPNAPDTDGDGLTDGDEIRIHQTNPKLADTDADGVDDATELELMTDPGDPGDIPVLYTALWQLGDRDGGQGEFSQEGGAQPAPGSPEAHDDDYYFAGDYAEVGAVATDEDPVNFDRALTGGDPINRIHFHLDDISASEGAEYRVSVQLCCLGPAEASTHDIVMRLNGHEFFARDGIEGDLLVRATVSGADAAARVGENVLELERTGGEGWIQFDYLAMDFRTDDTDRDRLPNSYETQFAFLNPSDPNDAGEDEDRDGLTNLEEYRNRTEPDVADTDSDGLNDGPEIKEHGSQPRVPDTDGDGLLDGAEVATHMTDVLDKDTDDDGLLDGDEIAAGSSPFETDSDGDGENDNDEVLYGTNPVDENSVPIPFEQLWQIGEDNDNQSEFTVEGGGNQPGPGSAMEKDDDYYFAGSYPDPIGTVAEDEEWVNFERALTSGDPFSRIHFQLPEDLVGDTTQMRLHLEFVQLGASAGIESVHDVVVRVNGNDIFSQTDITEDTNIDAGFLPARVDAVAGANTIEIERTGQSASSWIQFDFLRLEQRMILTDDPNLLVKTKNIFGELPGPGAVTRTLEVTNTGQEHALAISGVTITGVDRDHFTVTEAPAALGPREKASLQVTFDPKGRAGGFTAFLELASNDSGDATVIADLSALIPNANGLVAHYPLDETGGTMVLDVSGRGRHGKYETTGEGEFILGEAALASGHAVSLAHGATGAAFARITDTFDPFADMSLSLWFQADDDPGVLTLVSKNLGGDSRGDPFAVAYNGGSLFIFAAGESVAQVPGVDPNAPHHLVVAFDNTSESRSIAIHFDGEQAEVVQDIIGFEDQASSPFVIGAMSGAFGFQGRIDDVQIYDKILSAADVAFLREHPGRALPGDAVVDPGADRDRDGQPNAAEALAGTDPDDPTSFFRFGGIRRAEGRVTLEWPSVVGRTYLLEHSRTLEGDWTEVASLTASEPTSQFIDEDITRTGGSAGYYRLRIP